MSLAPRPVTFATPPQNRQTALRQLARVVELILVVGASNSSNSNRLREIGSEDRRPELPRCRRYRAKGRVVFWQSHGGNHRGCLSAGGAGR